jgi:Flp pilus assembly protein TadB
MVDNSEMTKFLFVCVILLLVLMAFPNLSFLLGLLLAYGMLKFIFNSLRKRTDKREKATSKT